MSESRKSATDPFALVREIKIKGPAPVHLWNPPYCGELDLVIRRDGSWWHEGQPIRRKAMQKLFASVLRLDEDGVYYLVTPVEKVSITVEDCPFVAQLLQVTGSGVQQSIQLTTNMDETITLDARHSVQLNADPATGEPHPTVEIRSGLKALIARSVFYQLVELAQTRDHEGQRETGIYSAGEFFVLATDAIA